MLRKSLKNLKCLCETWLEALRQAQFMQYIVNLPTNRIQCG